MVRALKTRLERMKCVYQMKAPREGELAQTELRYYEERACEKQVWEYLAGETVKP